ncbi:MAG: type II secretion system F family protein [Kineosporiaceae bacterium]|nr:type II secretion system F family protein [Aeromicrobium sp.]
MAVFLGVPPSARTRCRRIFGDGAEARNFVPPPTVLAMALSVLASLTLFGMPTGLLVAAVAAPMAAKVVGRLESSAVRRRRNRIASQLPGAIDLLIAVLDAGRPPVDAFTLVARAASDPLGAELALIAGRLSVAGDEQSVWEGMGTKAEFAALGRSFRRAGRSGMPVGRILGRLADELRRERRTNSQERARSVAVMTAAPLGVCFLPAFFLVGIVPTIFGAFLALPL